MTNEENWVASTEIEKFPELNGEISYFQEKSTCRITAPVAKLER